MTGQCVLCGEPAEIGRYCHQCLEREIEDLAPDDLEAVGYLREARA